MPGRVHDIPAGGAVSQEFLELNWSQWLSALGAIGAFGAAAVGVTDALTKFLAYSGRRLQIGLPYVGFSHVERAIAGLAPALRFSYGDEYRLMLAQQYRHGRASGRAPQTIEQGVRLALPFMERGAVSDLIRTYWGVSERMAADMAAALKDAGEEKEGKEEAVRQDEAVALIGRFAVALDTRIDAAFNAAEERYRTVTQFVAGATAVILSLGFNWGLKMTPGGGLDESAGYSWTAALFIGVFAVPLAPVAKDLSTALSSAFKSWRSIGIVKP